MQFSSCKQTERASNIQAAFCRPQFGNLCATGSHLAHTHPMAVLLFRDHGLSAGKMNKNDTDILARKRPRDLQDQAEKYQDDRRNHPAKSRPIDPYALCQLTALTPLFPFLTAACPPGHRQHLPQALPGCWAQSIICLVASKIP